MPAPSYHVTDAELAILEVIWGQGPSTIREITEPLYPSGSNSDYATVQKLLGRLEKKGCVTRDRSSYAHVFRTAIRREHLVGHELQDVATRLCAGSLSDLVLHLVRGDQLSAQDRAELRRLLEEDGGEG